MPMLSNTVILQYEPITNTSSATLTGALLSPFRFDVTVIFVDEDGNCFRWKELAFIEHLIQVTHGLGRPVHYYTVFLESENCCYPSFAVEVIEVFTGRVGT